MRAFVLGLDLALLLALILYWEWRDDWYVSREYRLQPGVREPDGRLRR